MSLKQLEELVEALHFLKMDELKQICSQLSLSDQGPKLALVERIKTFVQGGQERMTAKIPAISCAKKNQIYPLAAQALMLVGAYKNDLKSRTFFKQLIGDHFHFTAFGIDWLKQRWCEGSPPTYQEFADMWQKENEHRKQNKAQPKKEWAYINFLQQYTKKHPDASHAETIDAWHALRAEKVNFVKTTLATFRK